jgi:beta-lactamase regulating signal transducer with metallopeptidase domain
MRSLLELVGLSIDVVPGSWPALGLAVCLRATLVLTATALTCAGLRRRPAAVRHLVWASALGGIVVLPLLTWLLPRWGVPILPGAVPAPRVAPHVHEPVAAPAIAAVDVPRPTLADGGSGEARLSVHERSAAEPALAEATGEDGRERSTVMPWTWTTWLAAAWGCGALTVLVAMLVGQARLAWWKRRAPRLVDGPAVDLAARLGDWLGLPRRVVLLRGEAATSPMTWGLLRPVILLPAGAEDWPRERLRAVLLHELAHVKRRDCLVQAMAQLACAGYWFHPLAWLAAHRLRIERERACDDLVLEAGATRATDYAAHLLDVARSLRSVPVPGGLAAAVPMARSSQLEGRLRAILDGSRSHRVPGRRSACLVLAMVGLVVVSLATARLQARASRTVEEPRDEAAAPAQDARPARMTVSGRVLDRAGRGVAGAEVAVVGRRKLAMMSARAENQYEVLGRTEADAEGRFGLEVPRTSTVTHYEVHAVAAAPGLAMGWAELNRDATSPSADVRLGPEQVVEGRLVDLQGVPAEGVAVQVSRLSISRPEIGRSDGLNLWQGGLPALEGAWPSAVTTDADGRFRLKGVGRGLNVGLRVDDPRFARQRFSVQTTEADEPKQATFALQPAMHVSGRVTCKDTGAPLVGGLDMVGSGMNIFSISSFEYHTDADGRYEANPGPGKFVQVTVYPPVGSPYLIFERKLAGDDGAARRVVDLAVPRGVLITGRITARGSGKPLAGASVIIEAGRDGRTTSLRKALQRLLHCPEFQLA